MVSVSIITVVKNGAATIRCCMESVRSQEFPVEHIVIDGGSTDGTLDILAGYSTFATVISGPDKGIYDGMNKGLSLASGDVVGILNADDFYVDTKVIGRVAKLFEDSSIDSCYGDLVYVDAVNIERVVRYWKAGQYNLRSFYNGWMPPHPTFFARRRCYQQFGGFNLNLGSAADYELMLRFLVKEKIATAYIPEVLVKMRVGGKSNSTLNNRIRANRMDRMAWKVNGLKPYPWTLWLKPFSKIPQYFLKH